MALGVFLAGATSTNAAFESDESKPGPGNVEQRIYALVREIDA
jgi:hypothetical protein